MSFHYVFRSHAAYLLWMIQIKPVEGLVNIGKYKHLIRAPLSQPRGIVLGLLEQGYKRAVVFRNITLWLPFLSILHRCC